MTRESLREKETEVLNLLIENYLKIGKPVSSGLLSQRAKHAVSPATVRNIMAKLEKQGYLYQPHTSAGRIPTDKGLRFYVNNLFVEVFPPLGKIDLPSDDFSHENSDFHSLLVQASKWLSEYSDNLGFVVSPRISRINFKYLRFVKISEEKLMIILVTTFNLVLTEVVTSNTYFTQNELDRASRYINENFGEKNLHYVHDFLAKEVPSYRVKFEDILRKLKDLMNVYFYQEKKEHELFLEGTSKLLEKPDFFDMERLKSLFQNFEEKTRITKLLSEFISLDRVKVLIGSEMNFPDIADCSLILSHYGYDRQVLGSLGIIGPKRIPYRKIIPLVDCVAKKLSRTISINR
ncbi:MAG: heat-inducible transcription repressor HrcA [Candidatus Aminicenantes bacterium]|nr:heat-inducible transcription repressor HrcA [Candidatus Aminicenantes bacterium]